MTSDPVSISVGRIGVNELVGRQEILREQFLDCFRLLVGPEGLIGLFSQRWRRP